MGNHHLEMNSITSGYGVLIVSIKFARYDLATSDGLHSMDFHQSTVDEHRSNGAFVPIDLRCGSPFPEFLLPDEPGFLIWSRELSAQVRTFSSISTAGGALLAPAV